MHKLQNKAPLLKGTILRQITFAGSSLSETPGGCKEPKLQEEMSFLFPSI